MSFCLSTYLFIRNSFGCLNLRKLLNLISLLYLYFFIWLGLSWCDLDVTWPLFGSNVKSSLHIYSTYLHTTYLHIYPQCRGVEARRAVTPAAGARLLSAGWWEHLLSRTGAARSAPTHHNNTITIYSNTGVLMPPNAPCCSVPHCWPAAATPSPCCGWPGRSPSSASPQGTGVTIITRNFNICRKLK